MIRMEVLAGARDEHHLGSLRRLLARAVSLPTMPANYELGAALYRRCRHRGETVRKMVDCLIASIAIHSGATLLHRDADFDVLERHTELAVDRHG